MIYTLNKLELLRIIPWNGRLPNMRLSTLSYPPTTACSHQGPSILVITSHVVGVPRVDDPVLHVINYWISCWCKNLPCPPIHPLPHNFIDAWIHFSSSLVAVGIHSLQSTSSIIIIFERNLRIIIEASTVFSFISYTIPGLPLMSLFLSFGWYLAGVDPRSS